MKTPTPRRLQPIGALLVAMIAIGAPLWLVLVTSAKSQGEAQALNMSIPAQWQIGENYSEVLDRGHMLRGFLNSLLVVAPTTVIVLVASAMAGWYLARRHSRLSSILYAVLISGLILPPAIITLVAELRFFGLANSQLGLIATYSAAFMSLGVFLITGFIRTLPIEIEEAAWIDGASPLRVFWQVVLPLLKPAIATTAVIVTILSWSDVFYAFFVLGGGEKATLPLDLYRVANAELYLNNWHLIFAFVVLMSLPMIVMFVLAQRRILSGVTSGAVK
ncbi:MAG: carbohydrate ABC transporter permease [Sinomonas sp.]|nr:carbohydrate ABC transporter permease [Sinomonas sp.]